MKLYEFSQNNSGGFFEVDDFVCHRVIIEAENAEEANKIALNMGIYFDGCSIGVDCNCCGDRWYPVDNWNEITKPYLCDSKEYETVEDYLQALADKFGWTKPDARIFRVNQDPVEIFSKKNAELAA